MSPISSPYILTDIDTLRAWAGQIASSDVGCLPRQFVLVHAGQTCCEGWKLKSTTPWGGTQYRMVVGRLLEALLRSWPRHDFDEGRTYLTALDIVRLVDGAGAASVDDVTSISFGQGAEPLTADDRARLLRYHELNGAIDRAFPLAAGVDVENHLLWAYRPLAVLGGRTPRHVAEESDAGLAEVLAVIATIVASREQPGMVGS